MSNALVTQGSDIINTATGEVVGSTGIVPMADYLKTLTPQALQQQQMLAAAYDTACTSLIGPNDVQRAGGRTFKKKSAWRKLARHFGISTQVIGMQRDIQGNDFLATVTVRAVAPWGQFAEAVGACGQDEETGDRKISIADAIATAETRATNRAVSNLIAMGEVSAEEVDKSSKSAKSPQERIMPFGKSKGKALGDLSDDVLISTIEWCKEKDAKKFADLITACQQVLADRGENEVQEQGASEFDPEVPF